MNIQKQSPLISLSEARSILKPTKEQVAQTHNHRQEVWKCIQSAGKAGTPPLIIVGPCSIHSHESARLYATEIARLRKKFEGKATLVMRAYFEKPRTAGGWHGLLTDHTLTGTPDKFDRSAAILEVRRILHDITSLGVPVATEFLNPELTPYIEEYVAWGCIGARNTNTMANRIAASALTMPVGIKNGTGGDLNDPINAIKTISQPHSIIYTDEQGDTYAGITLGNTQTHIIHRGGSNGHNYDRESVEMSLEGLKTAGLNQHVMIDCSHANCEKDDRKMLKVIPEVIKHIKDGLPVSMMIESHIESGNQSIDYGTTGIEDIRPSKSITDKCISIDELEKVLEGLM